MGTWDLPSPFTQEELQSLIDEFKGLRAVQDLREQELDEREMQLDSQTATIAERFQSLARLRTECEEFARKLDLRELEVIRDEEITRDKDTAQWREMGEVLAGLDETVAGQRLVQYLPEEAAAILRAMTPAEASTLLNSIDAQLWKEYMDAYTGLSGE